MDSQRSVADQEAVVTHVGSNEVWAHMARILIAEQGHHLLDEPMSTRSEIQDGRVLFTWTEAHFMSEADYNTLVKRAREAADGVAQP